jgi:hypothetical protein
MKKLAWFVVGAALLGGYWYSAEPQSDDIAFNRIWLSHLPQHERDKFDLVAFIHDDKIGIFQDTSAFQGSYDVFGYSGGSGTVTLHMLQDNKKVKATYTATKCNVKNFDYCLEIKGTPRGPVRYYSQEDWVIESKEEALQLSQEIASQK